MRSQFSTVSSFLTLICASLTTALNLDISNSGSIKTAAQNIAHDLLGFYDGTRPGAIPGLFSQSNSDVYWGESGAAWGSLIGYWSYTGDSQYNDIVQQALLWQKGPRNDFMPPNQTKTEGNDDQSFWALAAMTAAEQQLPNAPNAPAWLDLASQVFDSQVPRWDTKFCGGGLRWQIFTFNEGYNYKNAVSTAAFFQLAARLARYTGNQTYADWADKSYDWLASSSLVTPDFKVYDGASVTDNCTNPNKLQWSYNAANFVYGSAVMYNFTNGDTQWKNRTQSFLSAMSVFFNKQGIIQEIPCESHHTCVSDQYTFKGIAAAWLGATVQMAPFTSSTITPFLQASAQGAAASCSGGDNKTICGFDWTSAKYDGSKGFGQELSALDVILANLAANSSAPFKVGTSSQSGNTSSNPSGTDPTKSTNSPSPSATIFKSSGASSRLLPEKTILPTLFLITAAAFFML